MMSEIIGKRFSAHNRRYEVSHTFTFKGDEYVSCTVLADYGDVQFKPQRAALLPDEVDHYLSWVL